VIRIHNLLEHMTDFSSLRESQREGWNREYNSRSPLWRGPSDFEVPLGEHDEVLELGCGDGKTLGGLLGSGRFVVATDHSTRAIEACDKRFGPQLKLNLVVSDVCALPFATRSFDAVVASHILEHLMSDDRAKTAAECRRILRPSGRAFVRVFSVHDMRCGKGKEVERNTFIRGSSITYHYFSEVELRSLFRHFREESLEERIVDRHFAGKYLRRVTLDAVFTMS